MDNLKNFFIIIIIVIISRLSQWRDGNSDLLLQEADRRNSGLHSSHGCALPACTPLR